MQETCLFGAMPSELQPVRLGGSEALWQRWSRWLALSVEALAGADPADTRTWRFVTAPGVLDAGPVAGAWRLTLTRSGNMLPLALMVSGAVPAIGAPWFDAATRLLHEAATGIATLPGTEARMARLPGFAPAAPPQVAAVFWLDDWEVHELRFETIHDMAEQGFALMLAPRPVPEEA